LRLLALRRDKALDLDLEPAALLVEADIAFVRVVTAFAIVEAGRRSAVRVLWFELEARRKHLFHQQARRYRLQGVVDGLGDGLRGGVRLGDQVGEAGADLARRVAGGAADNLHDLGQARSITDGQRVLAPDPVEAFLRHTEGDDDVHMVANVLLRRVLQRGGNPIAPGGVGIID